MGCGTSKETEENTITNSRTDATITQSPEKIDLYNLKPVRRADNGIEETDPLLLVQPGIREKVAAANNASQTKTKHVHELGMVNITENPFDGNFDIAVDMRKEEEAIADFLSNEFRLLEEESQDSDLQELRRILRKMLGMADRKSKSETEIECGISKDDDVRAEVDFSPTKNLSETQM